MTEALQANIDWKSAFFTRMGGSVWSRISGRRRCLPLTIFRKEKLDASIFRVVSFFVTIHAFASRQTDGQTHGTDVSLMAKTALFLRRMQHDKY